MRSTSSEALMKHELSGKAGTQRAEIFKFLKIHKKAYTRQELSRATGIAINAVCGRVSELKEADAISELDRRPCRVTGSQAHPLTA